MNTSSITMNGTHRARRGARSLMVAAILLAGLILALQVAAQEKPDDSAIWTAFISWFKSAPLGGDPFDAYAAKLEKEGVPVAEVERRLATIARLFPKRPEGVEAYYDRIFSMPLAKPGQPGFNSAPSDFVVEAAKGLKPGAALDLGTGQGRNAVYLAGEGWSVTGLDLSQVGLDAARENAAKSGVRIQTVKAAYDSFDFGIAKWDLIVMDYAWAPVSEPDFVAKLEKSLRPGGVVLFEHFINEPNNPYAPMVRALDPGELKDYFGGFEILSYEEGKGKADWGGPGSRIVRMLARKKSRAQDPSTS